MMAEMIAICRTSIFSARNFSSIREPQLDPIPQRRCACSHKTQRHRVHQDKNFNTSAGIVKSITSNTMPTIQAAANAHTMVAAACS